MKMKNFKINIKTTEAWLSEKELASYYPAARKSLELIHNKTGKGNDYLGWLNLPEEAAIQAENIINTASDFKKNLDCIVIIGIGGSYLGTKAVLEALSPSFAINMPGPEICYAGHHLNEEYLVELLEYLENKNWGIVVISKSGKTTEPALAFRILNTALINKYGKSMAREKVIAITDSSKGALRTMAEQENYKTFIIPDDIGGRYSVLTPVGLVPIALAGFNIKEFIDGAREMMKATAPDIEDGENPSIVYASLRNALLEKGKTTEILTNFNPRLHFVSEWWKQLFGESEGKDGKGIFPASVDFTTDLHSMGQFIQDGPRNLFETFLTVGKTPKELRVPEDDNDLDQLNYISGKRIEEINSQAALGTLIAHMDGGVPVIQIQLDQIKERELGALMYFFELACGISGYMLGVNPFDQPGVEAYKNNMFALLGKPGFENQSENLKKRLDK